MSPTVPHPCPGPTPTGPRATPNPGVALLSLAERLDALLPQTQCTRCGYPDCRSYADALAAGDAQPNRCPPGGAEGVRRLAQLLDQPALPLNPANGVEGPRSVAFIDEANCIGCTLCIQACPVDAIIGAPKRMHAVAEPLCTGCELCVPACPVDCIELEEVDAGATGWAAWSPAQADAARARHAGRRARLDRDEREYAQRLAAKVAARQANAARTAAALTGAASRPIHDAVSTGAPALPADEPPVDPKRAAVEAALARARLRAKMRPS